MNRISMLEKEFPRTNQYTWINDTSSNVPIGDPVKVAMSGANKVQAAIVTNALHNSDPADGLLHDGEEGQIEIKGRYTLPKIAATAIALFETVIWDVAARQVIIAAPNSGDYVLGYCSKPAASADAFVQVELNTGPDKFTETA